MNNLAHTMHNPNVVTEIATGIRNGDSQLYRWECARFNFKFEAWVSWTGDYSLAKSKMNILFREAVLSGREDIG